jgi:DNA-binding transcriptional MocR family regulator
MIELGFQPEERSARGLAKALGQAVRSGTLEPGTRLPPIRSVAKELGLAPATVHSAWAILARSGVVHTDGRRGTTVTDLYSGSIRYSRALEHRRMFAWELSTGTPDLALLPDLASALAGQTPSVLSSGYLDAPDVSELIDHLRTVWPFEAQALMIVDGAMDAMELATRTHVRFGDRVVVEDPCFPMLIDGLEAAGAEVIGVKVDQEGMLAKPLAEALARPAAAVYLQPRAQNPTGVSLSPARARQLASVIGTSAVVIVEDDSAGDIATTPAISLGAWLPEQTLHIRSFSKSHGPDLRLAAISGPTDMIQEMTARRRLGQGWTSRLLQRILLHLLTDLQTTEAIARARATYRCRRAALVQALAARGIRVGGCDGFNIWVPVASETGALVYLASRGIGAAAGAPFTLSDNQGQHIRVTISSVDKAYQKLAAILAEAATAAPQAVGR